MENKILINQRISISMLEMAMKAALGGTYNSEYAMSLAAGEYAGQNRIKKCLTILNRLTLKNPLFPYVKEHEKEFNEAIHFKGDRALVYAAIINSAYPFGYDTTCLLGKFFNIQRQVNTQVIVGRMSAKYGSNRATPNGLYCILPMLIDAGLIVRPQDGIYEKAELEFRTHACKEFYRKSFFINNPLFNEDMDYCDHSYFCFVE